MISWCRWWLSHFLLMTSYSSCNIVAQHLTRKPPHQTQYRHVTCFIEIQQYLQLTKQSIISLIGNRECTEKRWQKQRYSELCAKETRLWSLIHRHRQVLEVVDLWMVVTDLGLFTVELSVLYWTMLTHKAEPLNHSYSIYLIWSLNFG